MKSIKKEAAGAAAAVSGGGLGTVHTADGNPSIFTPTYGERSKKKESKNALSKLQDWLTKAKDQQRHYGEDTGELNKPGEIPGVPEVHDDLEWDKKKNPDHKTSMPMSANTSTTFRAAGGSGIQNMTKDFGARQDDELSRDGKKDKIKKPEQREDNRSEQPSHLAGNAPEPIPSVKMLPGYSNPGMETGSLDAKQKKKYSEEDHENTFIGRFEKMMGDIHENIEKEDTITITSGNDDANYTGGRKAEKLKGDLDQPAEPPTQNNELQVLGQ